MRKILGLPLSGLLPTLTAAAQTFPSKPARIAIGFPAGGPPDQ